ncbi:T9SS type A sorting domain-containing protein (plasmid) [Pedobacter sp. BS3]|uniref:Ig-like domain-containing protein n=1 Tax=Pedobacter sp. BS3 TaxID=2567937 RepID=UPI0011EC284C|nr:Ig-like domain-containing protein [Pedobacter sp. BS3]TZF86003.1 T9SS type A sorting domain-containing protein [Pedobacter sp. BS3]
MKMKTTIIAIICTLLYLPFSVKAAEEPACSGNGQDGDYHYQVTQADGKTYMTFIPDKPGAGSTTLLFFYGTDPAGATGANTPTPNVPYELTGLTDGQVIYFYFVYNNPDGPGNKDNSGNRHSFIVGQCSGGSVNIKPTVSLTSPAASDSFTSPATINISANAADEDGTVTKVEFYNGSAKIGESTSTGNPYTFQWTNVQPGTYSITAKATDNMLGSTTSSPVVITVNGSFTTQWCGQSAGNAVPTTGDEFEWRAETDGSGNVTVTLHGIGAAAGCDFAIVNGNLMTYDTSSGYLTATLNNQTSGTALELKFTYRRGSATNNTGENNNIGNPVTYTVGDVCAAPLPVSLIDFISATANGIVTLKWSTASESNNSYFLLERSTDGKVFSTLDKIPSKGSNSTTRQDYQFMDRNPANGTNYYRLTQVDNDGKAKELAISTADISLSNTPQKIYPNPLKGNSFSITLNKKLTGPVTISISDLSGEEIYKKTVQALSGKVQVELSAKPATGVYVVKAGHNQPFKLLVE